MTAETCSKEGCSVPMMRSPRNYSPVTTFCANCDGTPDGRVSSLSSSNVELILGIGAGPSSGRPRAESSDKSPSSYASTAEMSRSSTPPTEISSGLSSPTFALPVETAESVRRRQQSDAASEEIGKRLLKVFVTLCLSLPLILRDALGMGDARRRMPKYSLLWCATRQTTSRRRKRSQEGKRLPHNA